MGDWLDTYLLFCQLKRNKFLLKIGDHRFANFTLNPASMCGMICLRLGSNYLYPIYVSAVFMTH